MNVRVLLSLLIPFVLFVRPTASADDHVMIEQVRSYMGMRYPPKMTEVWMSKTSVYVKSGRFITITRYDLMKRWTLSPDRELFVEQPLTPPANHKQKLDTVAIQRAGWNYEPVYDWVINETQREELVGDIRCRLIVADGDADYSSDSIELWIADKSAVDVERFNVCVTATTSGFDWENMVKVHPALSKCFIVKSVDKTSPPIAPEIVLESRVAKVELGTPPPGIYEIPEGFRKATSIDDLTK